MTRNLKEIHSYLPKLAGQLEDGKVSRREFLRTSTLLGLSATTAYAMAGMVDPLEQIRGDLDRAELALAQAAAERLDGERLAHLLSGSGSCCVRSAARSARVACASASISGRSSGNPRRSASAIAAATQASKVMS